MKSQSLFVLLALVLMNAPARADMMLTSAGTAQNLTLSTFATGFPSAFNVGPLGMAFLPGDRVMISDYPGDVRVFAHDKDNQNAASASVAQNYGFGNAVDLAQLNGKIYMTQQSAGNVVRINSDGTLNQVLVTGIPAATGMVADSHTGHLYISANNGIYDVDPVAKTKKIFVNSIADGLTISADGRTIYGEVSSHILGWDAKTGTQMFDSGFIPGGPDGTAIGAGKFADELFVNTNGGQLWEIDEKTMAQTLLATGGSRGDFVTVDTFNDTLLLTQTDRVLRLTGATFVTTSPEPASIAFIGCGLVGLAVIRRRRS